MDFLTSSTHLHITTWVVGLVLFFVAAFASKSKGIHMALRLFYILIIITGGALFTLTEGSTDAMLYGIKFVLGLVVISMMELVLVRKSKNKSASVFWIIFFVALIAILYMGFRLPMGFNFLAPQN